MQSTAQPPAITLRIRNCGNIVSFKNSKQIARKNGRPTLITQPRKQAAMAQYIRALESELLFAFQTYAAGTPTACNLRSWIASCVPADDSWKHIPISDGWECVKVPPGQEGADITIERLPD